MLGGGGLPYRPRGRPGTQGRMCKTAQTTAPTTAQRLIMAAKPKTVGVMTFSMSCPFTFLAGHGRPAVRSAAVLPRRHRSGDAPLTQTEGSASPPC